MTTTPAGSDATRYWSASALDVSGALSVDPERGLSEGEARARLEKYGPNALQAAPGRSLWKIFASQFLDLMIALLAVAAIISLAIGEPTDSILIGIIVIANAIIGSLQEWRAEKAVEALKKLSQPRARVWRDGQLVEHPALELVPGDVVELRGGDFVPGDCRVISAANLQVDEAPLTGESMPIEKTSEPAPPDAGLADRTSMAHSGTAVTAGHGRAIITGTGMSTELGKIATLIEKAEKVKTPLERRLAALSRRLAIIVLAVCAVIFVTGILREGHGGWDTTVVSKMLLVSVSLAVAAIPEGLPAVITIALALGSQRMSARRAIVRRLAAVETLGSVDVICSDKTGTLTLSKMTIADIKPFADDDQSKRVLLRAGVLCNDAAVNEQGEVVGSPTEAAFVHAAIADQLDPREIRRQSERIAESPFSSDRKRMSTVQRDDDGVRRLYVKGAVEAIIDRCCAIGVDGNDPFDEKRKETWKDAAQELAARGRRVMAIAVRRWDRDSAAREDEEADLSLLGIVGIVDPVRPEAIPAIARCRSAGIRPVMITGDHRETARVIASELDLWRNDDGITTGAELDAFDDDGLREASTRTAVYARVSPEHKLRIVKAHQALGSVVAMTGDGVNDAPALKQADIGIAMGQTGTDVSKEAADAILADDNFVTIVAAVEEGRVVYDNIRKFVRYLLTANAGEILVLFVAILLDWPLPLLPVHILWINLVTDGLPALALGFEPAEADIMKRPPRRRDESIFAGGLARDIVLYGILSAAICLATFWGYFTGWIGIDVPAGIDAAEYRTTYAQTMVFFVLAVLQLFFVLAIRSSSRSFFALGLLSNWRLNAAVTIGFAVQLAVTYIGPLQKFFHTTALSPRDLALGIAASAVVFVVAEVHKLAQHGSAA